MRLIFCLSLLFLLNACAGRNLPLLLIPADQQLFMQGMASLDTADRVPEDFVVLQQRYPESPWAAKAQTIKNLLQEIQKQKQIVRQLQASQANSRKQSQKLQQQIESLGSDLKTLEAERTKLRQLLIDMEQRSR